MSADGARAEDTNSLVQNAQSQIMNAAMNGSSIDMASVLAKIHALEKEKNDLKSNLENTSARLSKLQEGKRAEMEAMMNSTITKWLEQLETKDTASKDSLREGLKRLVSEGNESGVWEARAFFPLAPLCRPLAPRCCFPFSCAPEF